ncbi:hypothetical protein AF72_04655 [Xylella taiwanensis]|uniref:Uncharacterized protein n=1 Tax=Xylella taiwanensis TaxID=1444770 RepID=Z9JKE3_9GAMM|nr:hypothetical protein AB672_01685 [Xylella taiwanensis]EWS78629.1 hypothetical protein AF72_04655 [Xylella taiwanensis]
MTLRMNIICPAASIQLLTAGDARSGIALSKGEDNSVRALRHPGNDGMQVPSPTHVFCGAAARWAHGPRPDK